jgi:broad specificity phosphatase PhoE
MLARFPDYLLPEAVTEFGWYTDGYEEWAVCHARAAGVAKTLRAWAADGGGQVAIVSHGGFADALLKALLHGGPSNNGHGPGFFYLHFNTAIDRVDIGPEGHVRVAFLNRVEHLPPDFLS